MARNARSCRIAWINFTRTQAMSDISSPFLSPNCPYSLPWVIWHFGSPSW